MAAVDDAKFGRYRPREVLGSGGFATVYLAEDTLLRRSVALKLLHEHLARDRSLVDRFRAEGSTAANLHHPNIVTIHDVGETSSGRPYIVMELLEGAPLSTVLHENGPVALDGAAAIISQVASALDYLHARGLVHRDLKPSNVMLDGLGKATLMDFGVARALGAEERLTLTGELVGTLMYMAPEQLSGGPITSATDVYALALLAYELVTNSSPFSGPPASVLRAKLSASIALFDGSNATLPPTAKAAILHAIAQSPSERPQTASAFARSLVDGPELWQPTERVLRRPHHDPRVALYPSDNGNATAAPTRASQRSLTRSVNTNEQAWSPSQTKLPRFSKAIAGVALALCLLLVLGLGVELASGRNHQSPGTESRSTTVAPGHIARVGVSPPGCLNEHDAPSKESPVQECTTAGTNLRVLTPLSSSEGFRWAQVSPWNASGDGGLWVDAAYLVSSPGCDETRDAAHCEPLASPTTVDADQRDTSPRAASTPSGSLPPTSSPVASPPPNPAITAATATTAPIRDGTFEIHITAQNFGGEGKTGSISVSALSSSITDATLEDCVTSARASVLQPGSTAATLGGGSTDSVGSTSTGDWLAEADFTTTWPAGGSCTLVVRGPVGSVGALAFLARATVSTATGKIASWPLSSSPDRDQQGYPAMRYSFTTTSATNTLPCPGSEDFLLPNCPSAVRSPVTTPPPSEAIGRANGVAWRAYGTVKAGGVPAQAGSTIRAISVSAPDTICGTGTVTGGSGSYFVDVSSLSGCLGDVLFNVNGQMAGGGPIAPPSITGSSKRIDLSVAATAPRGR